MHDNLSVLQHATRADVHTEPFPHVILQNALPEPLCNELIDSYPPLEMLGVNKKKNNKRWNYSAHESLNDPQIPSLWRDFVRYHCSAGFFHDVIKMFGEDIVKHYPELFPSLEQLLNAEPGIRYINKFPEKTVLLDAQISGNTPVRRRTSVRPTHVDLGNKLFSGLFYMRQDDDLTQGGDLTISRFKPNIVERADKLACFEGVYVRDRHTEIVKTVRYAKNTLVLFLNTLDSLHGVTVRESTPHCRLFLNLIGEVNTELYPIRPIKKTY
ncbi:MAG: hypothetical protein V2J55_19635 [Candidatus Competibacteraceae bacterium]|jgi:hypothetical protein|nr:hypothetical protein [Candidatus Competibacteraceae bacterium]